jgi:hypothetical protein
MVLELAPGGVGVCGGHLELWDRGVSGGRVIL